MMRAMPSKLEGKGVVEVSSLIKHISSSAAVPVSAPQQWNNIKLHHLEEEVGQEFEQFEEQFPVLESRKRQIPASPIDSEPTSTLDTTRRSPSPLSSFTNITAAGVADPTCIRKEDWASELHNLHQASSGGERLGAAGLDDWDTMFPTGDGALLPWITGDPEDPNLGLKQLLQSAFDYEGNAGLGPFPLPVQAQGNDAAAFLPSDFGTNAKITALLSSNCSSAMMNPKVSNHSSNCLILNSIPVNSPHQFKVGDEKPKILNPHNAHSLGNPNFLMPPLGFCQLEQHLLQPPSKRHNPGLVLDPNLSPKNHPFMEPRHDLLLRKQHHHFGWQQLPLGFPPQLVPPNLHQKPMMAPKQKHQQQQHFSLPVLQQQQQLQEQDIKNQLFKVADLIFTGNFSLAQEILARLNHQLPFPPKPLFRAALYVKEALQMLLLMGNPVIAPLPKILTPCDVVNKMNAYKLFSEVSPIAQFVNFTCTQATLEALDDADAIHIIDFDIGCGAQWASFIQELPLRKRGAPSLKISALAPLSTSHPFELGLIRENLLQFANDIGIAFELQVINLDLFDPSSCSMPYFRTSEDEAIAVNIPIWASSDRPSILPPILEFVKQCSPKIVVSFDRGFDRCDVPFPQHLVHILDSCANFLESLDGLNVAAEIVNKIEKFFVQPRIENTLLARVHVPEKMPHWKNLFNSAGFSPVQFSTFTETQADYVVKKTPGRGFNVEKRQASLVLSWQRRELVAASAWRC